MMDIEQLDARIDKLKADLVSYAKEADGTIAQMQARLEATKTQMQTQLDAMVRELQAQQTLFWEERLRMEGKLAAWEEQRAEIAPPATEAKTESTLGSMKTPRS